MCQIEGLYVMSIDYNIPDFLKLRPDFEAIAVDEKLLEEFIKLVGCSGDLGDRVNVQYDTTFCLCDYYVSIMSFVHPFIETARSTSPAVSLFYFFHSRKFLETYEAFWSFFAQKVNKQIKSIFIITDCEDSIRTAIKNCLKEYKIPLIRCIDVTTLDLR